MKRVACFNMRSICSKKEMNYKFYDVLNIQAIYFYQKKERNYKFYGVLN